MRVWLWVPTSVLPPPLAPHLFLPKTIIILNNHWDIPLKLEKAVIIIVRYSEQRYTLLEHSFQQLYHMESILQVILGPKGPIESSICGVIPGMFQQPCWSNLLYRNITYIQTAAALCTRETPSCLALNESSFSIGSFYSGSSNLSPNVQDIKVLLKDTLPPHTYISYFSTTFLAPSCWFMYM